MSRFAHSLARLQPPGWAKRALVPAVLAGALVAVPLAGTAPTSAPASAGGEWISPLEPVTLVANVPAAPGDTTQVNLLGFNDFHGNIEPPSGGAGRVRTMPGDGIAGTVRAGGVEFLAAEVKELRAGNPAGSTFTVGSGDFVGASPLISAAYKDEPTIELMNSLGMDFIGVGNHEFDEGTTELSRLQRGSQAGGNGCSPPGGPAGSGTNCQDGDPFGGASFQYLAANVINTTTNQPPAGLARTGLRTFDGVTVGFIGVTLEATPGIVSAGGIQGFEFRDEADTANALVPELQAAGADTIVLLVHQGGFQGSNTSPDGCVNFAGADINDVVQRLSRAIPVVVSGHTHSAYNCRIATPNGEKLVTSAQAFGTLVTEVTMSFTEGLDPNTHTFTSATATNNVVENGAVETQTSPTMTSVSPTTRTPDPEAKVIADKYRNLEQGPRDRVIGRITAAVTTSGQTAPTASNTFDGESALGDLIADAQLEDTAPAGRGGAQIAFMNPGGVRADLVFPRDTKAKSGSDPAPREDPAGGDGQVTFGEAFTVQPFGNNLVTLTLTGAEIDQLLEQQFVGAAFEGTTQNGTRILLPSSGFTYTFNLRAPLGQRIDPASIQLNGTTLVPSQDYRVTVNSFLADGGDGFSTLSRRGRNRTAQGSADDLAAFEAYFARRMTPVSPPVTNRVTRADRDPAPVIPEAPVAALLPLAAVGLAGLGMVLSRRRRRPTLAA